MSSDRRCRRNQGDVAEKVVALERGTCDVIALCTSALDEAGGPYRILLMPDQRYTVRQQTQHRIPFHTSCSTRPAPARRHVHRAWRSPTVVTIPFVRALSSWVGSLRPLTA